MGFLDLLYRQRDTRGWREIATHLALRYRLLGGIVICHRWLPSAFCNGEVRQYKEMVVEDASTTSLRVCSSPLASGAQGVVRGSEEVHVM